MVLGFGRKATQGVGCYGKLPLHGDYVSHQGDAPEARRLTAWVSDGYRLTGGRDDREAAGTRFLLPGKRTAILGTIFPSADKSGTRRFPFVLFAELPEKTISAMGAAIPLCLESTWSSMFSAFPEIRNATTPEALRTELGRIGIGPLPEPDAALEDLRAAATEAKAGERTGAVYFDALRLAGALCDGRKGEAPAFAASLRLTTAASENLEAAAWLAVFARAFSDPDLPATTGLFLRPRLGDRPGELFLFHRDLRPEDLGHVLSPAASYEFANVLGDGSPSADENAAAWLTKTAGPDLTLRSLMDLSPAGFPG
ncbi:MAG: type VI secretion system-associated protein TagF [Planctomycetes bacterium]|jgi:type VI secretion system ImpM family protein|nr:type VI secretion system-associated protein TagF [Planctomycetota bacterium]